MISISPYVLSVIVSLLASQAIKYGIVVFQGRRFDHLRQIYASGNMPSTHAASVTALLVVIALYDGTDSGLFGLALLFAIIVMYDAVMVRRSVGDQGNAVQELIRALKSTIVLPRAAKGHTPAELAVGVLLGVVIGLVVFFATK